MCGQYILHIAMYDGDQIEERTPLALGAAAQTANV